MMKNECKSYIGNKMKKVLKLLSACSLVFSLFSCEVGLGKAVDVIAPTVKVISPDRTDYIQKTFIIEGEAKDNIGISLMELQIQPLDNPTDETTLKFRVVNNTWEKYVDGNWENYESDNTKIEGTSKNYKWQLEIDLDSSVKTGTEYDILTRVYDIGNNENKDSKDERSVTIDMEDPVVSIISPVLKLYENESSSEYNLKDNSVLKNLMNGEFTISGSQKEDARLDYLMVYLDEKTDKTIDFETLESEATFVKKITGDNLRNWSTSIDLSKIPGYEHNRKTVRLVTESHDKAGNVERKVQGWFTYYNDADVPWVVGEFGGSSYDDKVSVYPSCALQGQAYDDDGIKQILINIYKENNTVPVKTIDLSKDLESEGFPTYKAWSVNALGENCKFRIEVKCVDVNGVQSEKIVRYMSVTDTNPPKIVIETDTSAPMLGDASGNITIKGYVTDDGGVECLKLLRVKTGVSPEELINYYNDSYSEWKKVSTSGPSSAVSNGNKLWEIPLSEDVIINSEHKRTFSKSFNIFTDFGINGSTEKLTTQNFILYASDGNSTKIDSFTIAGDTETPVISITNLVVKTSSGAVKETIDFVEYNANNKSKKLQPFNRDSTGKITDKVVLSGRWSDNSTDNWSDKTKKNKINLVWEGLGVPVTVTPNNSDSTWKTNEITPPDSTTAIISVDFSDFGGNISKANENFFISSSNPELLNISSQKNDGSYKAGVTIPITLEFNKAVTFSGGTGNPSLTLNTPVSGTKSTAKYVSGNGTATHVFEFVPKSGEDVAILDVTAINTNGNVWKEVDGNTNVKSMAIPYNDNNKLKGSRSIVIDTIAPEFSLIKAISNSGSYSEGKEIFILAEFSEDVKIQNVEKIKLQLNESVYTTSTIQTGANSILFTYVVGNKQNFSPLKVSAISLNGAVIQDAAGNTLIKTTLPACEGFTNIKTDTVIPAKPTVMGLVENDVIYSEDGVAFTLAGIESDASVKKYSIDGGKSWSDYTGKVYITSNGDYNVTAYQQDAAGNKSENADFIHINIDSGNILTSISAGIPTGTYTVGKVIPIYLNFRKNVILDTASLSLNLSNGQTADYDSGSGTTQAKFTYTVKDGDFSEGLNVTQINGTFTDEAGKIIDSYVKDIPSGKNLLNSRIIKIITDKPVVTGVTFSQASGKDVVTINFSADISKGNGNVTFTHDATSYLAPSVITPAQYNLYYAADSNIANYYSLGTNGSNSTCVSDLSEKYILNYDIDTDNEDLISILKRANADKVIIPVNSTYVKIATKRSLQITLENTYKLPVKGANYSVRIDEGLIKDLQNNQNALNNSYTVSLPGIETPVIRINKSNETISNVIPAINAATITQPLQTSVKIDCQTPDVDCYYLTTNSTNESAQVGTKPGNNNAGAAENPYQVVAPHALPTTIAASSLTSGTTRVKYTGEFKIGSSAEDANRFKGFVYLIGTRATKTINGTATWSSTSYETAYRTAVKIKHDYGTMIYRNFWIRGGDNTFGNVETKDFPFSWDSAEFDKIRAMTETAVGSDEWYWVTWKINTTAYIGFVNGDVPSDASTNGPARWCWGDCGFVGHKSRYPLYPGSALSFFTSVNWNTWVYSNQVKKCEYRDGTQVVKAQGESSFEAPTSYKTSEPGNSALSGYKIQVKFTKAAGDIHALNFVNPNNTSSNYHHIIYNDGDLAAGQTYTETIYTTDNWDASVLQNSGIRVDGYGLNVTEVTMTSLYSSKNAPNAGGSYSANKWALQVKYKKSMDVPSYKIIVETPWSRDHIEVNIASPSTNETTTNINTSKLTANDVMWGGATVYGYGLEIISAEFKQVK